MPKTGKIPRIHCKLHEPKSRKRTSIFFICQKGGRKFPVFPNETISPSDWDFKRQRAKTGLNRSEFIPLNERLDRVESAINAAWQEHWREMTPKLLKELVGIKLGDGKFYSIQEFIERYVKDPDGALKEMKEGMGEMQKALLLEYHRKVREKPTIENMALGRHKERLCFLDFIPYYIRYKKKKGKTIKELGHHIMWYIHLKAYCSQYGNVDFETLDYNWAEGFKEFCYDYQEFEFEFPEGKKLFLDIDHTYQLSKFKKNVYSYKKKELRIGYVKRGSSKISEMVTDARRKKHTDIVDIPKLESRSADTLKTVIYFDEWERIYQMELSDQKMVETRYIAFAGAFTGLRISDIPNVGKDMIRMYDGERSLEIMTQKTKTLVAIPLLPIFENIMAEIDWQLPPFNENDFRVSLKELCRLCGLTEKVHAINDEGGKKTKEVYEKWETVKPHSLRRSFATNFILPPISLPKTVVQEILGHSSVTQTEKYINIGNRLSAAKVSKSFRRRQKSFLYAEKGQKAQTN